MEIPGYKKEWFEKAGFPAEVINATDEAIGIFDEKARLAGRQRKAKEADMPEDKDKDEEEKEEKMDKEVLDGLRKEIADAVAEVVVGLQESIIKEIGGLNTRLDKLEKSLAQLEETDAEKLARQKEELPPASLSSIIAERLMRDSGKKGNMTRTDPLANKGPAWQEPEPVAGGTGTGIAVLDGQIAGSKKRGGR